MVYIQAKTDKKDANGNVIKKGIDLFVHENSVCDSAISINQMGEYNLDNRIIKWFGIIHDLGKANPLFLSNMLKITDAREVCCRHEISSVLFIDVVPEEIRDIVAMLVLSHHKSISYNEERSIRKIVDISGRDESWFSKRNKTLWNHINGIEEWGKNVVAFLKEHYNIDAEIPTLERCKEILYRYATMPSEMGYSEYRGLCMMADHIASAYEDDTERIINFEKLFKKPNISFYTSKNEKYPLSLIDSDESKKHTFCIAPCGCGKTNFILKRCKGRIFYMLPFQASINAMAKRVQHDIGDEYLVGVKHASYKALDFIDDTTKELSNLFGLPVKVMTPFQVMSINFRLKGYEAVIMDMKNQDVILDEIHTYSGKNMACVIELIKILNLIGCHIHVCTATMPMVLKNEIISILGKDNTQFVKLKEEEISTFNRHIVHTRDYFDLDEIKNRYENGEKVLVVHNQIKKSVDTYMALKRMLGNGKIMLLHSQFERGRRAELEHQLIFDFNKSNEPCIVVSTQVVEVSIDINFDVMYTDCADIMSLIQRFGRINRQRNNIGIYKDVFVIDVNDGTGHLPYDAIKCKNTFNELKAIDGKVLDENYIQTIIDRVHPTIQIPSFDLASPIENGK
jgi:CRISPR-associated endonuclease/helicase Cas3